MNVSFKWRLTALVTLVAFCVISCPIFLPDDEEEEDGKGEPMFFWLNKSYQVIENDEGITGFMLAGNKKTDDFFMTAEEMSDVDVVRSFFLDNKTQASMYYSKDKKFPHRLIYTSADSGAMYVSFSEYNTNTGTYDVDIEIQGEKMRAEGLLLNKELFSMYKAEDYPDFNDSQNRRAENIILSICLWASLGVQVFDPRPLELPAELYNDLNFSPTMLTYSDIANWIHTKNGEDELSDDARKAVDDIMPGVMIKSSMESMIPLILAIIFFTGGLMGVSGGLFCLFWIFVIFYNNIDSAYSKQMERLEKEIPNNPPQQTDSMYRQFDSTKRVYAYLYLENSGYNLQDLVVEGGVSANGLVQNGSKIIFPLTTTNPATGETEHPTMQLVFKTADTSVSLHRTPNIRLTQDEQFRYYLIGPEKQIDFDKYKANEHQYNYIFTRNQNNTVDWTFLGVFWEGTNNTNTRDVVINDSVDGIFYKQPIQAPHGGFREDSVPRVHHDLFVLDFLQPMGN